MVKELLGKLAETGNQTVQFGILVLVGLSGFGNWVATWNSADRNKTEIEASRRENSEGQERIKSEVVRQVAEIHKWLNDAQTEFHNGNKDSAYNRQMLDDLKKELDEHIKNHNKQ
jgi:hypothetical protein